MKNKNILSSSNLKLFLYLFLFWSLAVAQPLMSLFGKQPEFLIAHEVRGWSLIFLTVILNVIIPFLIWLCIILFGFVSTKLKEWLTRFIISMMLILFVLPFVNSFSNNLAYLTALTTSILLVYLLIKFEIVKTFALWFSPISLIFMLLFLFFSSAKQLLPSHEIEPFTTHTNDSSPVFVFLFDEFPLLSLLNTKEKINQSRFPNTSKLLEDATWYKNATTISSATAMAIPAILSGIQPNYSEKRLAVYDQYQDNLFSLFSSTHKINAIENTTRMCPQSLCKPLIKDPIKLLIEDVLVTYAHYIYPQKKKAKLPPINDRWVGFLRELNNENEQLYTFSDRLNTFNSFLGSFENFPNNTLHFLHVLIPHAPWRVLPDESLYGFYELDGVAGARAKHDPTTSYAHQWTNDEWATNLSWRRHLLQIGAVDSLIGKAVNKIKEMGLYEQSTIIILADHGAAFIPNLSRRFAHNENIADIAAIPLIIKYPNQKQGNTDSRYASNLDIVPTLLELFSLNKGEEIDGISLLSKNIRQQPKPIYQEGNTITELPDNYQQLIDNHLKYKQKQFPGEDWNSIYHTYESTNFFNMDIATLEIKNTLKDAARLQNANLFSHINKASKYIPAYYRIQSLLDDEEINEILVAINGKVVSHCFMFKHSPKECAGLIDPKIYKSSNNNDFTFQFFSVINKEKNNYVVNELLTSTTSGATIETINGKEVVKYKSGKVLPIVDAQPYGSTVIRLINNSSTYQIGGWSGNTDTGQSAEKVYVFVDNKLFTTTQTGIRKRYLYKLYGFEALIHSGFEVTIPFDQYPKLENHKVRVFASTGNESLTEVNYTLAKKHETLYGVFNSKTNRKIPVNKDALMALKVKNIDEIENVNFTNIDAFNDDFKQISTGDWLTINKHTRWTGSNVAVIVPIKDDAISLSLSITAKPLIYPGRLDKQTLIIYTNDKPVKTIEFTELSSHKITVDLQSEDKGKPVIIKLEMPDAAAPTDFLESNDKRKLSLFITDFRINVDKEKAK